MDLIALAATPVLAYLLVVGIVALDATFPAIPSDAAVVSAGALAAAGHLSLGWSVAAVVAGAMAGDHLVYALARHKLPGILERSRLGRRIRRNADRAYGRMEGVSTVALAMGRFIPFGRTAASATAGLVGVPALRYLWISLLGAGTWAAWMVGLGFFTGHLTGGPLWIQVLLAVSVGFVVAAGLAFLQRAVARRKGQACGGTLTRAVSIESMRHDLCHHTADCAGRFDHVNHAERCFTRRRDLVKGGPAWFT